MLSANLGSIQGCNGDIYSGLSSIFKVEGFFMNESIKIKYD